MITAATLREYTSKDLGQMAKKRGIVGWHSMRKDELIKAIVKDSKLSPKEKTSSRSVRAKGKTVSSSSATVKEPRLTTVARTVQKEQIRTELEKDLAGATNDGNGTRDKEQQPCVV